MRLPEKLEPYKGRILITLAALVLVILLLTIGFWKTLLVALICGIGYVVGSYRDGSPNAVTRFIASFTNR